MRSLTRAALVTAALLTAAPLAAQTSFSIAAGAAVPVGTTGDALNVGYNATVGIGIKPPVAPLGLRIEGMLNGMEGKTAAQGKLMMLAGLVNVTVSGGAPVPVGYLIGGAGIYNMRWTDRATLFGGTDSDSEAGFNVGAGINFPLTGFSTFLEARFHYLVDSEAKLIPITFGLRF